MHDTPDLETTLLGPVFSGEAAPAPLAAEVAEWRALYGVFENPAHD